MDYQFPEHRSTKQVLILRLFVFVLMVASLGTIYTTAPLAAQDSVDAVAKKDVAFTGPIEGLPDEGMVGEWEVAGRVVWVDDTTKIKENKGEIALGAVVLVEGSERSDGIIAATKIVPTKKDEGKAVEFTGIVLALPSSPEGLGEWTIQKNRNHSWRVLVDLNTRLDLPLPLPGQWAEVEGIEESDGIVLATKLRRDDYEESEVVVRLKDGVDAQTVAERHELVLEQTLLASANIHLLITTDDTKKPQKLVEHLAADEEVIWAELNYRGGIPVADPYDVWKWGGVESDGYVNQQAFEQIKLPPVQPFYKGSDVIVAVLDTGVSFSHPQLSGVLLPGRDLVADDALPEEEGDGIAWGHGTHITGIIVRIAPESKVLPVRVLDPNGRGDSFIVAYAIEWAVQQGADVINLSLGTPYDSNVLQAAIDYAEAHGVIVVAAAGNDGNDKSQYPAAYSKTVAVTAVDAQNRKAGFANYSTWVDLAAPGVGITSTVTGPNGDGYASWSGTSMATSFVSGAAALNKSKSPEINSKALQAHLFDSGMDIDPNNRDHKGRVGRLLNTQAALGVPTTVETLFVPFVIR